MTDGGFVEIHPVSGALDARVRVPGSKSITNRALLCAALAEGRSTVRGVLEADDAEAMIGALRALGVPIDLTTDLDGDSTAVIDGVGGVFPQAGVEVDARQSGTTARFLLPVLATMPGRTKVTGSAQLRARPMGELLDALAGAGAGVESDAGRLPAVVGGRLRADVVRVRGDVTSQFLSGLMLAAPLLDDGLHIECTTPLVSRPYVELTAAVMADFGARAELGDAVIAVDGGGYRAADVAVEPDASTASYFLAAPLVTGGRVVVEGLGSSSRQGDARFVEVLERMGAAIDVTAGATTVEASGRPQAVEIDLVDMPDLALTVAAVAVFADGPTTVTGVSVIRGHESDRLAVIRDELAKVGVEVTLLGDDGFTVTPPSTLDRLRGARIESHDDHRVAMSFALLGLRLPGVTITQPGCVSKTFPGFWDALASLQPS